MHQGAPIYTCIIVFILLAHTYIYDIYVRIAIVNQSSGGKLQQ